MFVSGKFKRFEVKIEIPADNGYKNNPAAMKRVDEHIKSLGPTLGILAKRLEKQTDGSWKLRIVGKEKSVHFVEGILETHYGFVVANRNECG